MSGLSVCLSVCLSVSLSLSLSLGIPGIWHDYRCSPSIPHEHRCSPCIPEQLCAGTQGGGGGGGLTGGGIAGVIIGVIAIVAIAVVAALFLLGRLRLPQRGFPFTSGRNGFDNALYSKTEEDSGKGTVSFGSDAYSSES